MSENTNSYEKKIKYKSQATNKKIKPIRNTKKSEQQVKKVLKNFNINQCNQENCFPFDPDDFYWRLGE